MLKAIRKLQQVRCAGATRRPTCGVVEARSSYAVLDATSQVFGSKLSALDPAQKQEFIVPSCAPIMQLICTAIGAAGNGEIYQIIVLQIWCSRVCIMYYGRLRRRGRTMRGLG